MSVVFISSEVEEMLHTVTHMGILRDGEKVGELEESCLLYTSRCVSETDFMLFKIFSKNENDTEAVYDLRTKEDAIVEEVSSQFENMIVFHRVTEGYVLMIKAQNTEETIQVAKDYVAALTKRMKKEKELQWFAGIGRAVERLHNLSESYDSASKAFAYQYQSSGNEAVFFDKLDNEKIERAEDLQQVDFTKVNSESLEEFLKNGKAVSYTHLDVYKRQAHMLEVCPTIADGPVSIKVNPLSMGDREDPARLVFTAKEGEGIATSLIDLGHRFRLIINKVDCKKTEKPMPELPVATAFWTPKPDLYKGAEAWILAGGAHHTAFSDDRSVDQMVAWAEAMGIESVVIDENTDIRILKNELRWNEVVYR